MHFKEYYDFLLKESKNKEINCLWSSINSLPLKRREFIYFLILHDYLSHGGDEKNLPYGCKVKTGVRAAIITVDKLPKRLQGIIATYFERIAIVPKEK